MKKIILLFIFIISFMNYAFSQKVIEMKYENGIYTIPCKVNGVPMKFIFDTGASDVSISLTEAKFLIKQGLLSDNDVKGKIKYKIANGEIEEGTKINLKEINIDGFILKDVEASIVHQLDAPLLLGQSSISKLGTFQLDGNKLIIRENNTDYLTFLNVDLTKSYSEFGFLQSGIKLNSVNDFKYVKLSSITKENHFLSGLKFNEYVVFNLNGDIEGVMLQDSFDKIENNQKERKAKEKFKELIKKLEKKFGFPDSSNKESYQWNTSRYNIITSLDDNYEIFFMYQPKFHNNTKNNKIETKELRLNTEKLINETLVSQSSYESRKFARINNNNFEFHNEIKIAYEGSKKEVVKVNSMVSYYLMLQFISSKENKKLFLDCNFDYLVFKVQLTDKYHRKFYSERKISRKSLEKLKVPFTENEILNLLEK
ncbi:MAG: retroviral-like aspartic protease family protein [Winogradskyella sp.]|uniref:retropepsin-like aspartic protease family protein n=1 Tax=Winogradskyella sp. TaxID=1883156 RepID=UPI0018456747|nr:retropepsin-like aspartic protease [Winogradskyella sp.]MBT8243919.1 retroviral-like aspartic protease family protein [Winogradskyella sp.]NNK23202.1 retroviral-like aspartic protease family protein [Winogradskyella sp.]